ncbi:hypothetical protein F2Q68_00025472 [Brassica cretica]|uniref:Uncharacterized protein n=1 Tax=Brassica cretica TaxID=69181 RepID=A0A8S9IHP9_BRACR|nr:hypothetical protein F2Q68_00025472 [Brassica cretica]
MEGDLPIVRLIPYFDTRYIFALDFQCHHFEVNHHPVAEVMLVLLKSGLSASQEEAVEEMKENRSMVKPCHHSTVFTERRPNFQCHHFEVNHHPVAEVMLVLLKSGLSASQEEAVEEMKENRSMVKPCHHSTVFTERRPSIFMTNLVPEVTTDYQNTHARLLFYCF